MNDEFNLKTIYSLGKTRGGVWTGILASPSSGKQVSEAGQLFSLVSIKAPKEFDSKLAGDLLIENIQDIYYEKGKRDIIHRLEKAFLSTAKRLEYLLQREDIAAREGIDLNIEAVVFYKNYVYMAVLGEGKVMLWRQGSLIDLTQGLKDLSGKNLVRSGSGQFKYEDSFILLSPSAIINTSEHDLAKLIKTQDVNSLKLAKDDPSYGLFLISVNKKEDRKAQEVPEAISAYKADEPDLLVTEKEKVGQEGKVMIDDKRKEVAGIDKGELQEEYGSEKETKEGRSEQVKEKINNLKDKIKEKISDKKTYQVIWQKIKDFSVKTFKFLKKYVWQGLLGMGGESLYIKGAGPRKSLRGIVILIIIAICLLYLSLKAINDYKDKSQKQDEVSQILSEVDESFINGRNLGEAGDISEATNIIESALKRLDEVREYGVLIEEIDAKKQEGRDILDEVSRVIYLTDENLLTDVAGFIEGASADDIVLVGSSIYIIDQNSSSIYEVSTEGGEVYPVIQNSGLASPVSAVLDSNGDLMIADKDIGIVKLKMDERKIDTLAGLSATSVGEVEDVDNYVLPDGVNILYILRPVDNDVRKITEYPSGYSLPELRLASERFSMSKDIEIDGKIYVLSQTEGVIRYYVDKLDSYTIVGMDKEFESPAALELDDLLVYVGDSGNNRVVVLTKGSYLAPNQGEYVAQFLYRGDNSYFTDIKEILVNDDSRAIYVLDGTRLFKADLSKVDEYAQKLL